MNQSWQKWLWGAHPRQTLVRAAVWAGLMVLILKFVAQPVRIRGISMEPTFRDGSFHLVNLLAFKRRLPQRGDVVAIRMVGARTYYLKRVLGVPGDSVGFTNGQLVINGEPVREPYVREPYDWTLPPVRLQNGEFFVAGDNRAGPIESHMAGVVRHERIAGGLWF